MVARIAALLALSAAILAGCDRDPHLFGSPFGDDACKYKGTTYSHTSAVCQSGSQYRCDDGEWKGAGIACANRLLVSTKSCGLEGRAYSPGSASCQSGRQYRCDDGVWRNLVAACKHGDIEARTAADARPCMHSGTTVPTRSIICKAGTTFRCEDSWWRDLGLVCQ